MILYLSTFKLSHLILPNLNWYKTPYGFNAHGITIHMVRNTIWLPTSIALQSTWGGHDNPRCYNKTTYAKKLLREQIHVGMHRKYRGIQRFKNTGDALNQPHPSMDPSIHHIHPSIHTYIHHINTSHTYIYVYIYMYTE